MKTNTLIVLVVGILVLGGGAFLLLTNDQGSENTTQETSVQSTSNNTNTTNPNQNGTDSNVSIPNGPVGVFTDYDSSLLSNAQDGDVVLFFSADWCSTCRALKNDINDNLNNIPSDVTILEADYQSDLAGQYQINGRQHTLIQVDTSGNELNRWVGSLSLETLLREII